MPVFYQRRLSSPWAAASWTRLFHAIKPHNLTKPFLLSRRNFTELCHNTALPTFSQTLQNMSVANADTPPALSEASTVGDTHAPDVEKSSSPTDRARWVANPPEPPGLWRELVDSLRDTVFPDPTKLLISIKKKTGTPLVASVFQAFFPILSWGRNYSAIKFKNDVLAGLTLASLCIPQVN